MKPPIAGFPSALATALLGLVAVSLVPPFAAAQVNPEIYAPVILGFDKTAGKPVELRPDGTGLRDLVLTGELSPGAPGQRWFLQNVADGTSFVKLFPTGQSSVANYNDLVVYDEAGSTRIALTSDRYIQRGPARWSRDGRRIAYIGQVWDGLPHPERSGSGPFENIVRVGLFVADVDYSGGTPVGVAERLVVDLGPVDEFTFYYLPNSNVSWSHDDQRIVYYVEKWVEDYAPGTWLYLYSFVARVDTAANCAFTVDGEDVRAQFAPDGSNRLAFIRKNSGTNERIDLYTTTLPADVACPANLQSQQITSAASKIATLFGDLGAERNRNCGSCFGWSPDGQWIGFHALAGSADRATNIYKIRSTGGRPVALTAAPAKKVTGGYMFRQWAQ